MLPSDLPLEQIREARKEFLALVADLRPDLHRYCARMTGSVSDGEDVVQDTLARAYYRLPELPSIPELRPWLFRVAHNRAIDHLRRYERRFGESLDEEAHPGADPERDAEDAVAQRQAVAAALTCFLDLPPVPRSTLILKDVLGHSLDEIAAMFDLSLPAVKAALHRGRRRLEQTRPAEPAPSADSPSAELLRYIDRFNARDWDAFRAMLAEDVRLDVVSRARREGREQAGTYGHNYAGAHDWHLRPGWLGDREVILVYPDLTASTPRYFIDIHFRDGQVASIRDYRYVPYVALEAPLRPA